MARRFPCPHCMKEMLLEPIHEGFEVPCPACGKRFFVPDGAGTEPAPGLAPPPVPPLPPPAASDASAHSWPDPRPVLSNDGTTAMVVGIVAVAGLAVCPVFALLGPVAWFLGARARAEAKAAGMEPPGAATAGFALGIVATALVFLGVLAVALFLAVAAAGKI